MTIYDKREIDAPRQRFEKMRADMLWDEMVASAKVELFNERVTNVRASFTKENGKIKYILEDIIGGE